ncbi:MAG: hypothetical protein IJY09_10990 [Lachnospiraceae bacterium]|nr:hypothetical protein [Lachnospiraceae bacterium]
MINQGIIIFSVFPLSIYQKLEQKINGSGKWCSFWQASLTYKYFRFVRRYCKQNSALLYIAEAPEKKKLNCLTEEQVKILEKQLTTSELLNDTKYLQMVYDGNPRGLAFAENRYRGTKLISTFAADGTEYIVPADCDNPYYHVKNGIRYTPENVGTGKQIIRMFGSCIVRGYGVADEDTIPNYVQELCNQNQLAHFSVFNQGTGGARGYKGIQNDLKYILNTPISSGEIVILFLYHTRLEYLIKKIQKEYYLDCSEIFSNGKIKEWWFLNSTVHLNHVGNRKIAERLFEKLLPILAQYSLPAKNKKKHKNKNNVSMSLWQNEDLQNYLVYLQKFIPLTTENGAIVMNCNPFTNGHLFLIQEAAARVEHLFVFVVEEDLSFFCFKDRFKMVQDGIKHLSNVTVLPSGNFMISALTFPEYFQKEENQDIVIDAAEDLAIFGTYIAPVLNIKTRFAGSEPFDKVTRQYNASMSFMLKQYNITFQCIERLKAGDEYISATKVRRLLKEGKWSELQALVPESTIKILKQL